MTSTIQVDTLVNVLALGFGIDVLDRYGLVKSAAREMPRRESGTAFKPSGNQGLAAKALTRSVLS
jgi:hypothetical protein